MDQVCPGRGVQSRVHLLSASNRLQPGAVRARCRNIASDRYDRAQQRRRVPDHCPFDIPIYCFSKTVDWQGWLEAKQDLIFRCCAFVEANGLSIAFPSQTLYLREDNKPEDGALSADMSQPQP